MSEPVKHVSEAWAVWGPGGWRRYHDDNPHAGFVQEHFKTLARSCYAREGDRVVRVRVTVEPIEEAKNGTD